MGFWLLLQNCHLSLTFCEEIMQTVIDSEEIHANFRCVIHYIISTKYNCTSSIMNEVTTSDKEMVFTLMNVSGCG